MPHTGSVTSSSAAEGWIAIQESKSALVQPIFIATANPWITSSEAIPVCVGVGGGEEVRYVELMRKVEVMAEDKRGRFNERERWNQGYLFDSMYRTYEMDTHNFLFWTMADHLVLSDWLVSRSTLREKV